MSGVSTPKLREYNEEYIQDVRSLTAEGAIQLCSEREISKGVDGRVV